MKTRGLKIVRYIDGTFGPTIKVENKRGEELERNIFTGKYQRVKKESQDPFGLGDVSRTSPKKKNRKKEDYDPFGIWG